jgi:hypothetical membrane protein
VIPAPQSHPAAPSPTGRRRQIGATLLVLGTVQFLVMHLIVQSAWTAPRYSLWNNYISDLGAVHCAPILGNDVCSPLHAGMNAAFIVQGALLTAGIILTTGAWSTRGRSRIWRTMVAITGISWIVVGLVPEDVNLTGHSIGALPIFILGNAALIAAGTSRSTRNRPAVRVTALLLGIIGLLGFVLTALATANPGGPIGIGGAERITVFPLQVWALIAGLSILVRPVQPPSR